MVFVSVGGVWVFSHTHTYVDKHPLTHAVSLSRLLPLNCSFSVSLSISRTLFLSQTWKNVNPQPDREYPFVALPACSLRDISSAGSVMNISCCITHVFPPWGIAGPITGRAVSLDVWSYLHHQCVCVRVCACLRFTILLFICPLVSQILFGFINLGLCVFVYVCVNFYICLPKQPHTSHLLQVMKMRQSCCVCVRTAKKRAAATPPVGATCVSTQGWTYRRNKAASPTGTAWRIVALLLKAFISTAAPQTSATPTPHHPPIKVSSPLIQGKICV